tara:strand:- start:1220 stop:1453 length:234 start_codon:yes stop_codon:yes gene_type:complete
MGLLDKLTTGVGSTLSNGNGSTPSIPVGATDQSKLQDTYSINGIPNVPNKPQPSTLDLDGVVPANNYRDNTPEGASF